MHAQIKFYDYEKNVGHAICENNKLNTVQTLEKLTHSHQEIGLMHERLTCDNCCNPANIYAQITKHIYICKA